MRVLASIGCGGIAASQDSQDILQHIVGILQEHGVPMSDHPKPLRFKIGRAFPIVFTMEAMLATIQFDDQPLFEADEIDDVMPDRVLPLEFAPAETAATDSTPELGFGICRFVPHSARIRNKNLFAGPCGFGGI